MRYVIEIPDTGCQWCPLHNYKRCGLCDIDLEELDASETHDNRPKSCPLRGHAISDDNVAELRDAKAQLDMLATVMLADGKKPLWERITSRCMWPIRAVLNAIEGKNNV